MCNGKYTITQHDGERSVEVTEHDAYTTDDALIIGMAREISNLRDKLSGYKVRCDAITKELEYYRKPDKVQKLVDEDWDYMLGC